MFEKIENHIKKKKENQKTHGFLIFLLFSLILITTGYEYNFYKEIMIEDLSIFNILFNFNDPFTSLVKIVLIATMISTSVSYIKDSKNEKYKNKLSFIQKRISKINDKQLNFKTSLFITVFFNCISFSFIHYALFNVFTILNGDSSKDLNFLPTTEQFNNNEVVLFFTLILSLNIFIALKYKVQETDCFKKIMFFSLFPNQFLFFWIYYDQTLIKYMDGTKSPTLFIFGLIISYFSLAYLFIFINKKVNAIRKNPNKENLEYKLSEIFESLRIRDESTIKQQIIIPIITFITFFPLLFGAMVYGKGNVTNDNEGLINGKTVHYNDGLKPHKENSLFMETMIKHNFGLTTYHLFFNKNTIFEAAIIGKKENKENEFIQSLNNAGLNNIKDKLKISKDEILLPDNLIQGYTTFKLQTDFYKNTDLNKLEKFHIMIKENKYQEATDYILPEIKDLRQLSVNYYIEDFITILAYYKMIEVNDKKINNKVKILNKNIKFNAPEGHDNISKDDFNLFIKTF